MTFEQLTVGNYFIWKQPLVDDSTDLLRKTSDVNYRSMRNGRTYPITPSFLGGTQEKVIQVSFTKTHIRNQRPIPAG